MSTNSECLFLEAEPDKWYMILEQKGPDDEEERFDWMGDAIVTGPFPTLEAAQEHLEANHANPGGWGESPYDPAHGDLPDSLKSVIGRAHPPAPRRRW